MDKFEILKRKTAADDVGLMNLLCHECHDGKEQMILALSNLHLFD